MTVHWEHAGLLSEISPSLLIERSLYVIDRDRITCAGGIAPLDFSSTHHRGLFELIALRVREGELSDPITLAELENMAARHNPTLQTAAAIAQKASMMTAPHCRSDRPSDSSCSPPSAPATTKPISANSASPVSS